MTDSRVAYFWTNRQDEVLAALRAKNLTFDPLPRRASLWRSRRRRASPYIGTSSKISTANRPLPSDRNGCFSVSPRAASRLSASTMV